MKVLGVTKKEVDVRREAIVLDIGGVKYIVRESMFLKDFLVVTCRGRDLKVRHASTSSQFFIKGNEV